MIYSFEYGAVIGFYVYIVRPFEGHYFGFFGFAISPIAAVAVSTLSSNACACLTFSLSQRNIISEFKVGYTYRSYYSALSALYLEPSFFFSSV